MTNEEIITITKKEYEQLREKANLLECLDIMGIDNWEGYDEAWKMMNEEKE